jgi:hypothetical protein
MTGEVSINCMLKSSTFSSLALGAVSAIGRIRNFEKVSRKLRKFALLHDILAKFVFVKFRIHSDYPLNFQFDTI